jgi:hypothetical protein
MNDFFLQILLRIFYFYEKGLFTTTKNEEEKNHIQLTNLNIFRFQSDNLPARTGRRPQSLPQGTS